ncbi:unnamed protein product [Parnassius apollo]|uniref:(apollo) hypothetical protein n=1 Tax=Parnassius apollo TaxID=110799 RepID=A0A8S3Y9Z9_PARAO|nr:unnamed protein product [Parnassius apollo]
MAFLNDDDIENELEQMFGFLDNPDESEDEYEGEDSLEIGYTCDVGGSQYYSKSRKSSAWTMKTQSCEFPFRSFLPDG